ncbi:hypothetical protein J7L68_09785 [bacterium]|nr:hypothetical protein [bacterium]
MNEVILLLFFIFFAIFGALGIFFLIRLSLKMEQVSKRLDDTLDILQREIPQITEQSKRTMQALETASLKAQRLMNTVQSPLDNFQSSGAAQAIIGFLRGFGYFKNVFTKSQNKQEEQIKE